MIGALSEVNCGTSNNLDHRNFADVHQSDRSDYPVPANATGAISGGVIERNSSHSGDGLGADCGVADRCTSDVEVDVPLVAHDIHKPEIPVAHQVAQAPKTDNVQRRKTVAQRSAHQVAQGKCATSGTLPAKIREVKTYGNRKVKSATPESMPGHEWKFMDSGWALFRRIPKISESGKRSSTRKYLRWYTQAAIERIYGNKKNGRPHS